MDIPSELIPQSGFIYAWVVYLLFVLLALIRAPWFRIKDRKATNIYFGSIVLALLFWNLNTGIMPGQSLHYLGASALCLMFGWEFAFLAIQVLIVTIILDGRTGWDALAWNGLIIGLLPTMLTHGLLRFTQKHLTHNYFIYFFINTFLATILGMFLIAAAVALLITQTVQPELSQGMIPFLLMMALPEGILTGMVISILVVYKPEWVTTFRDNTYLRRK